MMILREKKPLLLFAFLVLITMVLFAYFEKNSSKLSISITPSHFNPYSQKVLNALNKPLAIEIYAPKKSALTHKIIQFVQTFQRHNKLISLQVVDPNEFPDKARQNTITMTGEMLFSYENRSVHVTELSEESFVNAILTLQNNVDKWIVFAEGFGMRTVTDDTEAGLYEILLHLKKVGYKVARMPLSEALELPDNVQVIVLPNPTEPLTDAIVNWLSLQQAAGKNIFWLSDVDSLGQQVKLEILFELMMGSTLQVEEDSPAGVVSADTSHGITENFNQPIYIAEAHEVLANSNHVFIKNQNNQSLAVGFDNKQSRSVVMGDTSWLSNQYIHSASNKNLAVRIFDYLLNRQQRVNLRVEAGNHSELHFSRWELGVFSLVSLFVIPLLFLLVAVVVWRRNRASR